MNFGPDHYVPVLKVKRGEMRALQLIDPAARARITPLLEIVERREDKKPTVAAHLDTAFSKLAERVTPYSRCFLDAQEMESDGPTAAEDVFRRASDAGITFTPVTGIFRTADVEAALNHVDHGIAIRLTREEFEHGRLAEHVSEFVAQRKVRLETTDIILDLGPVDDLIAEGMAHLAREFLSELPELTRWRTLTVSGCAFPKSMREVGRNSHALVERAEWLAWRDHLYGQQNLLPRLPTYGDCGIQHPTGVEGFDPVTMQVSASVRYALAESWLLIKGESTRRNPARKQFPQLAKQLVYGHLRDRYAGEDHCEGCALIKAAADGADRLGSPEVWRRIGTIHHATVVTQGLASLYGT